MENINLRPEHDIEHRIGRKQSFRNQTGIRWHVAISLNAYIHLLANWTIAAAFIEKIQFSSCIDSKSTAGNSLFSSQEAGHLGDEDGNSLN